MSVLTKVSDLKIGDQVKFGGADCEVDGFSGSSVTLHKVGSSLRGCLCIRATSHMFGDLANRVLVFA